MDVLSDVLQLIRLKGTLFFTADFHEPWCLDSPESSKISHLLLPGEHQLAICHLVVEGSCWVQLHGEEAVQLQAGEAVMLPHGDAHLLGSGMQHAPVDMAHALPHTFPALEPLRYGGNGNHSRLVCGWFAFDRNTPNPLVNNLPRLFRSPVLTRPCGPAIRHLLAYALTEAATHHAGSGAVAAKAAELLFVEALLGYIETLPPLQTGWLAGLRDPQIGRSLALMHERPAHAWTVDELSQSVHMSRSSLAQRFSELLGMPPMQYLKRWRLGLAARRLDNGHSSLGQVAAGVGYESEAAFNRAFKAEFGLTPGQWRRRDAQSAAAA